MMMMMMSMMQQVMEAISGFDTHLVRYQPDPPALPPTPSPRFSIDDPDSPFHVLNCSESLIYIYIYISYNPLVRHTSLLSTYSSVRHIVLSCMTHPLLGGYAL